MYTTYQPEDFKVYNSHSIKRIILDDPIYKFDLSYAERLPEEEERNFENAIKVIPSLPLFRHRFHHDIIFNLFYRSENQFCKGAYFYIIRYYTTKRKGSGKDEDDDRLSWVTVRFIESFTNITIPYFVFKTKNIYDPYNPIFGGYCSIGNIRIGDYPLFYNTWKEVMRRLFDELHPLFHYFGGNGVKLKLPTMACFETFIEINKQFVERNILPLTDPNDPNFYMGSLITGYPFTPYKAFKVNKDIAIINRMPYYEEIPADMQIPLALKKMASQDRTEDLKPRPTGRPKGVKNKKHQLYRLVKS